VAFAQADVKAIRLSLHNDLGCGKSGKMRIILWDRQFGTCVTNSKTDFTRGQTYTWEHCELTRRDSQTGYVACKDFVPSENTAVLIQAKATPRSEGEDQFCPLTVEIETGSGDKYKTRQMNEWYDYRYANKLHQVYRDAAEIEIVLRGPRSLPLTRNKIINRISLLSKHDTECDGRDVKVIAKMGNDECETDQINNIAPDQKINWTDTNSYDGEMNIDMGTCRNFEFDTDGHLILVANSNSQSFLEHCIVTVDVVLQDGTRFVSQRNDRWFGSGTGVAQWIVPTAPPRQVNLVCPTIENEQVCPKADLRPVGSTPPVNMMCFPEPTCDFVSATKRSTDPADTFGTGYNCIESHMHIPTTTYCCVSRKVQRNGVVEIPKCGDGPQDEDRPALPTIWNRR